MAVDLDDCAHWWGSDLILSPTGDLARASGVLRSQQRVLRRLLTNPGDYLCHIDYGGGLPKQIGLVNEPTRIKGIIVGQMRKEASVSQASALTINIVPTLNGISAGIHYVVEPQRSPSSLSFSVEV